MRTYSEQNGLASCSRPNNFPGFLRIWGRRFESFRARQLAHCPHNRFVQCVRKLLPLPARGGSAVEAGTVFVPTSMRIERLMAVGGIGWGQAVSGLYARGRRDWQPHKRVLRRRLPALRCASHDLRQGSASLSPDAIGVWRVTPLFERETRGPQTSRTRRQNRPWLTGPNN